MDKKYFRRGLITGFMAFILLAVFVTIKFFNKDGGNLLDPPDISLNQVEVQDLKGQKVELTDYIGKPLVVNYWATWCKPCIEEFPHFNEIKGEMENEVNFLMISDESIEKITKFKNSKEFSFNYLRTNTKLTNYQINTLPTTYFYNSNGTLVNKYTSNLTKEKLVSLISEIK